MARFTSDLLDLSRLLPPEALRGLDYETILPERLRGISMVGPGLAYSLLPIASPPPETRMAAPSGRQRRTSRSQPRSSSARTRAGRSRGKTRMPFSTLLAANCFFAMSSRSPSRGESI